MNSKYTAKNLSTTAFSIPASLTGAVKTAATTLQQNYINNATVMFEGGVSPALIDQAIDAVIPGFALQLHNTVVGWGGGSQY